MLFFEVFTAKSCIILLITVFESLSHGGVSWEITNKRAQSVTTPLKERL